MVHRKGELTKAGIDRGWPHQVALPAEGLVGTKTITIIDRFCKGLSICPRHHTYWQHDKEFIVYCFAEKLDADYFRTYFGGEPMTPETRPKHVGRRVPKVT